MKARIVHTSFYDSERVLTLSKDARWLFMYYLTCKGIGLTGAFKWSNSKTLFECGLTPKELTLAKQCLLEAKLVFFKDEWVVIPNTEEKTGYGKSPVTQKAYANEKEVLPDEIKSLLEGIDTLTESIPTLVKGMDTHRNRNKKSETKEGGVGETPTGKEKSALEASELITHFNLKFSKNYQLTDKIKAHIRERMDRYSTNQLREAIDRLYSDPFYRGENDRKWQASPEYLFRADEQVDKALNLGVAEKRPKKLISDLIKERRIAQ